MADPWKKFELIDQFSVDSGEYDLPIYAQAKQRAHNGRSKIATRQWESTVNEAVSDQTPLIIPSGRLSLQVLFLCRKWSGDLTNLLKSLEDALNGRAYVDDRQIDHINGLRIIDPTEPERILVRLRERK